MKKERERERKEEREGEEERDDERGRGNERYDREGGRDYKKKYLREG